MAGCAGISPHAQVKDQLSASVKLPNLLRHIVDPLRLHDSNGKASQASNVFRAMSSSHATTVLIMIPVNDVMAAVFDAPVTTVSGENALRVGLLLGTTGNADRLFR